MKTKKIKKIKKEFADEHALQRYVVDVLRKDFGFIVDVSSSNLRGRRQHRGSADFKVTHESWERGKWIAFESKNPNTRGRLSEEQLELMLKGRVIPVWSWNDVAEFLDLPKDEQMSF